MSERMVNQFLEMVKIDSESGNEAKMMEYLLAEIPKIGGQASLDDYGNLLAKFPAKGCQGKEPVLLSCHADTFFLVVFTLVDVVLLFVTVLPARKFGSPFAGINDAVMKGLKLG